MRPIAATCLGLTALLGSPVARAAEAPGIVGAQDDIIVTATAHVEAELVSR